MKRTLQTIVTLLALLVFSTSCDVTIGGKVRKGEKGYEFEIDIQAVAQKQALHSEAARLEAMASATGDETLLGVARQLHHQAECIDCRQKVNND
jgi:hypothetical protein